MKIIEISSEDDYVEIDNFFGKIWKDEFDIEAYNQIEKYKKCNIYCIKENSEIISAIIFIKDTISKNGKNYIWRFATKKEYRGKGHGSKLLEYIFENYNGEIFLDADIKQVEFYKKFGFIETGEKKEIGNTHGIGMKR